MVDTVELPELDSQLLEKLLVTSAPTDHHCWLVTGAESGDGASIIVAALARMLAARGASVLMVDANLKHPGLHRIWDRSLSPGLADVIFQKTSLEETVVEIDAGSPLRGQLRLLPAGETDRDVLALFSAVELETLLGNIKKTYDFTIVDSAALSVSSATARLAHQTDGVILTVSANKTARQSVRTSMELLSKANAAVLGTVLNRYRDYVPSLVKRLT